QQTMRFSVALKMRNFAELQDRVNMHEIISLDEMRAKYFPLASDVASVRQWLIAQGFQVEPAVQYELSVFATGTVAQAQRVFGSTFARVQFRGEEHTSAITAPSLPNDIAQPILGINGLQPHLHAIRHIVPKPAKAIQPGNGTPLTVPQIQTAYDASVANGTGQTIAILIDTFPNDSDLTSFWAANGVPQSLNNIQKIQVLPGTLPASSGEETLDVSWSSGIASGAVIRIYATADSNLFTNELDAGYQYLINDLPNQPTLHQLSLSFGIGEDYLPASQLAADDAYFATITAAGVTIFASSGDGGSNPDSNGNYNPTGGLLQVENPASDPNVIAVGGTTLLVNANGNLMSETAWSVSSSGASGGGQSVVFSRPSWQGSIPIGGSGRLVPDVAMDADPNTGVYIVLNGKIEQFGGTSVGPPIWAGICARINQVRASNGVPPLGILGPKIYPLLGSSAFRDIVSGSNGAYSAGPGFDLVTGIGSPDLNNLIAFLEGTPPPGSGTAKSFDNSRFADLVWENTVTGQRLIWFMNAGQPTTSMALPTVGTSWHIAGVGDFLGNRQSDLVWENTSTGDHLIWIMLNGVSQYSITLLNVAGGWHIVGAGDFNGDGKADLVWENSVTGQREIWLMNNGVPTVPVSLLTVDPSWHIAGVGDFLGNKQSDLVLENTVTGLRTIWLMNGVTPTVSINLPTVPPNWHIGGAGDFFGTGQASLVWEDSSSGECLIWAMSNGQSTFAIPLPTVGTDWKIVDH
ncbi:MAG: FG-GAP repeat protein, partial [Verrucomicrobia bacterium]|nr:FG-GAP repeat protein [Verrucomicrobiota bacterium]